MEGEGVRLRKDSDPGTTLGEELEVGAGAYVSVRQGAGRGSLDVEFVLEPLMPDPGVIYPFGLARLD